MQSRLMAMTHEPGLLIDWYKYNKEFHWSLNTTGVLVIMRAGMRVLAAWSRPISIRAISGSPKKSITSRNSSNAPSLNK